MSDVLAHRKKLIFFTEMGEGDPKIEIFIDFSCKRPPKVMLSFIGEPKNYFMTFFKKNYFMNHVRTK